MGKIVYGFMQINFIFRCYLKYKNIYFQKKTCKTGGKQQQTKNEGFVFGKCTNYCG